MSYLPKYGERKRKQEKKWTGEEIRLFIEMVKDREALWNSRKAVYRDRFERHKCWEEISVATHHSISDCKYQLNTIKSRYNAEYKKIESTKSGESGVTYESKYEHFEVLKFLDAVRNSATRENTQSNSDLIIDLDEIDVFEAQSSSDSAFPIITPVKHARVPQNHDVQSQRTAMLGKLDEFLSRKVAEETASKKWQQCYGQFVGQELASFSESDAKRLRGLINKVIDDFVPESTKK